MATNDQSLQDIINNLPYGWVKKVLECKDCRQINTWLKSEKNSDKRKVLIARGENMNSLLSQW